jgi:hypothetical protein
VGARSVEVRRRPRAFLHRAFAPLEEVRSPLAGISGNAESGEVRDGLTTTDHRHAVRLAMGAPEVARMLDARPASWLGSFLRLAALRADALARPTAPPWFRIGSFTADEDAVAAPFSWRPHLGDALFSSFRGRLVVRQDDGGSQLVIEGAVTGGPDRANDRVIEAFLASLGSALEASQAAQAPEG